MRPSKPSPLKLSNTNREESSASKQQRGNDDDNNSEKNYELREFEKIEQSISESSVFDLDTSLKTRRESSQCDRISPLNSIHNKQLSVGSKEDINKSIINKSIIKDDINVTEAMALLQKNPQIKRQTEEELRKLATDMKPIKFRKGDVIIRYGEVCENHFILSRGKIKITEYEPGTSPADVDLEDKIVTEKFVSEEGQGFGKLAIASDKPYTATIEAVDNACELYIIEAPAHELANLEPIRQQAEQKVMEDPEQLIERIMKLPEEEKERLRNTFPSRQTFDFDGGLQITSDFESGNLENCCMMSKGSISNGFEYEFDLWISSDSQPYVPQIESGRAGFFFAITGCQEDVAQSPKVLSFHIKNFCDKTKLLSLGHMPVYLEVSKKEYEELIAGKAPLYRQKWKRVPGDIKQIRKGEMLDQMFQINVSSSVKKTDYIFVSYAYPYTFKDYLYSIKEIKEKCASNEAIHFESRELVRSLEGRPVHLLTICSKRALINQKPVIFLTGRVHSGETPASYMIQGIMDKLTEFGQVQTEILLNHYIFKMIPMLNPDGVARGYWRLDTLGLNLNSYYKDPSRDVHPTIWATKDAVTQEHKCGKLKMYVDFHARCSKRGSFLHDNTIADPSLKYESMMIPKLMSLNCVNFDFRECIFSDEKSKLKNPNDDKEGQVLSSIFKETTNNPFTYTFDINYTTGLRINNLAWRYDVINDKKLLKEESPIHDTTSSIYKGMKPPIFTQEIYADVG